VPPSSEALLAEDHVIDKRERMLRADSPFIDGKAKHGSAADPLRTPVPPWCVIAAVNV